MHGGETAKPMIDNFLSALISDPATGKIGTVGSCWDGRAVLLQHGKGAKVDAVVANHPSLVTIPVEFEVLAVPAQINVSDKDPVYLDNDVVALIKKVMAAKLDVERV